MCQSSSAKTPNEYESNLPLPTGMGYISSMFKYLILPILSSILLAAHFSRIEQDLLAILVLFFPLLFLIKRMWIVRIFQIYLVFGGIIWIGRLLHLRSIRISQGEPWLRLSVILGLVASVTLISALSLQNKKILKKFEYREGSTVVPAFPSLAAFLATASLLLVVHFMVNPPILLLERFIPGSFGIEIFGLSLYAAFLTEKMTDPKKSPRLRNLIWLFFSIVFFVQFLLGIAGFDKFLMTGELHLPIPAIILAGPLYRGHGLFMLILFSSTVLIAGSAWCSHLCYIGSWDNSASRRKKRPVSVPNCWTATRYGIFTGIVLAALLFRLAGIGPSVAAGSAIAFGVFGVGIMIVLSGSKGVMTHCTIYCPMGVAADVWGKLSPFRLRFNSECNDCGACRFSCRYQALESKDIQRKKPGLSCTLCGDCIPACPKAALEYNCFKLSPQNSRLAFLTIIVILHAVFLGVARL